MFEPEQLAYGIMKAPLVQRHCQKGEEAWLLFVNGAAAGVFPRGHEALEAGIKRVAVDGEVPAGTRLFAKELGRDETEQALVS